MHLVLKLGWWLLRLPYTLLRDMAKMSLAIVAGFLVLFCIASLMEPLGAVPTLAALCGVILIGPDLLAGLAYRFAPQPSASGSELPDQALSLPDGPIHARVRGVTEVYRGDLTTLPRA